MADEGKDERLRDFWWAKNRMIDQAHIARMGIVCWAVYCCFLRHCDDRRRAWPAVTTLMTETGLSNRSVIDGKRRLCDLKYLRVDRLGGPGKGSNVYVILEPPNPACSERRSPRPSEPGSPGVVNDVHLHSEPGSPDVVNDVHSKKTHKKTQEEKNSCMVRERTMPTAFPPGMKPSDLTTDRAACWTTGKVVCFIPLVGALTKYACVTQAWVDEMGHSYPGIDVKQELRNYKAWAVNNPKKRKSASGLPTSINTWLKREQDRNGGLARGQGNHSGRRNRGIDLEQRDNVDAVEPVRSLLGAGTTVAARDGG
jgi:hypothetical protein